MQKYEPVMSTRPKRPRLRVSSKTSGLGLRLLEVLAGFPHEMW